MAIGKKDCVHCGRGIVGHKPDCPIWEKPLSSEPSGYAQLFKVPHGYRLQTLREFDATNKWIDQLSDLQRDADRWRWLIEQVGKVKLNTGTFGGCAKLLDIGHELSEYIDFIIDNQDDDYSA